MGLDRYITQFDVFGSAGTGGTQIHVGVAVDQWKKVRIGKEECCWFWMWTGVKTYDFGPEKNVLNLFPTLVGLGKGKILERYGLHLKAPIRFKSSPEQDIMMEKLIQEDIISPLVYNVLIQNCIVWAVDAIAYGLDQPDEDSCFVPRIIKNE